MRIGYKLTKNVSKLERDKVNKLAALSLNQCSNLLSVATSLMGFITAEENGNFKKTLELIKKNNSKEQVERIKLAMDHTIVGAKFIGKNVSLFEGALEEESLTLLKESIEDLSELAKELNLVVMDYNEEL